MGDVTAGTPERNLGNGAGDQVIARCAERPAKSTKRPDWTHRPYRRRYAGILRQTAHNDELHPIRDRALIEALMPPVLNQAKEVKRQAPRAKYRNIEITNTGLGGRVDERRPYNVSQMKATAKR